MDFVSLHSISLRPHLSLGMSKEGRSKSDPIFTVLYWVMCVKIKVCECEKWFGCTSSSNSRILTWRLTFWQSFNLNCLSYWQRAVYKIFSYGSFTFLAAADRHSHWLTWQTLPAAGHISSQRLFGLCALCKLLSELSQWSYVTEETPNSESLCIVPTAPISLVKPPADCITLISVRPSLLNFVNITSIS